MSYWGPLEGEPWWLKALAFSIKPGLFIAILAVGAWVILHG